MLLRGGWGGGRQLEFKIREITQRDIESFGGGQDLIGSERKIEEEECHQEGK